LPLIVYQLLLLSAKVRRSFLLCSSLFIQSSQGQKAYIVKGIVDHFSSLEEALQQQADLAAQYEFQRISDENGY
jgi:hypothetical protein